MSRRYFQIKTISEQPITIEQFQTLLQNSVLRLFGEFGLAQISPRVLSLDVDKCEATVRCNRDRAEDLQAALGLISDNFGHPFTALTLHVSGTIKGLKRKQGF